MRHIEDGAQSALAGSPGRLFKKSSPDPGPPVRSTDEQTGDYGKAFGRHLQRIHGEFHDGGRARGVERDVADHAPADVCHPCSQGFLTDQEAAEVAVRQVGRVTVQRMHLGRQALASLQVRRRSGPDREASVHTGRLPQPRSGLPLPSAGAVDESRQGAREHIPEHPE